MNCKYLVLAAALSPLSFGNVQAGEDINELRSVNPSGIVRIHCTRGEISIIGWDRDDAQVSGELDDLARDLQFETHGDDTFIRVRMPGDNVNRGDGSDLVIHLPRSSRLQVDAVSADVNLSDMVGPLAIRTVSGDVSATGTGDVVRINTTSGDIDLVDGVGQVRVTTTSGETTLRLAASEVQVDSVSGEIELELGSFDSVIANTVSADLDIEGTLNPGGRIESVSVSSEVEVALETPVNARVSVRAGPGGEIDNSLNDDEPRRLDDRSWALDTTIGDASGEIRIETVNGEIELERR